MSIPELPPVTQVDVFRPQFPEPDDQKAEQEHHQRIYEAARQRLAAAAGALTALSLLDSAPYHAWLQIVTQNRR